MKRYRLDIRGAYCGENAEEFIISPFDNPEDLEEFIEKICDEWCCEWWDEQGMEDYEGDQDEYRMNFMWDLYLVKEDKYFPEKGYHYVDGNINRYIWLEEQREGIEK